ncbi:MAG: hypothetical protein ACREEO_10145 [Phenylobacterium sp.]
MAHGTPDWGVTAGGQTVFQLTDLAEHAVRVSSIDSFDRGGDVVFLDAFEAGLERWLRSPNGTGASIDISTAEARSGLYACRLVGGSDGTRRSTLIHYEGPQEEARLGFEFSFQLPGAIEDLHIFLDVYDGVNLTVYEVQYVYATNVLQYRDAAGAFVTFATIRRPPLLTTAFNSWKLVIDQAAKQYVRFRLNRAVYSLAGISGQVIVDALDPLYEIGGHIDSRAGQNDLVYLDDAIFTQNEPG